MPAFYFPLEHGVYEVKPGLSPLGRDFGNGPAELHFFQIDEHFDAYRQEKLSCRSENLDKYFQVQQLPDSTLSTVMRFIVEQLCHDYPEQFTKQVNKHGIRLECLHTHEPLDFSPDFIELSGVGSGTVSHPLDAIAMQLQEDISIVQLDKNHDDYLAAIHLCFANHWAAGDKIGQPFTAIHQPVAGIENISLRHREILKAMIHKGPFVRFAWGLATDKRLNHHPVTPPGKDDSTWQGREFNSLDPQLYLRVERQCIQGFPQQQAALFSIRTYFYDIADLKKDLHYRASLVSAIQSMTEKNLAYKGLQDSKSAILDWLTSGN